MATTIGVRSCSASTPVPRSRPGAAAPAAARVENASGPVVSAVQKLVYPTSAAVRAVVTARSGPRVISEAKVTPARSIPMGALSSALAPVDRAQPPAAPRAAAATGRGGPAGEPGVIASAEWS